MLKHRMNRFFPKSSDACFLPCFSDYFIFGGFKSFLIHILSSSAAKRKTPPCATEFLSLAHLDFI